MRTTLNLDDDILAAARVMARQRRQPIDAVISHLARQALAQPKGLAPSGTLQASSNGLPLLPLRPEGAPVDLELVNALLATKAYPP